MGHSDTWVALEHVFSLINVSNVTNLLTGGIHRGIPSADAVLFDSDGIPKPYATIRTPLSQDLQIVNGIRIWSAVICDVIAVGRDAQWDVVDQGYRVIDGLLQATDGSTASGRVFSCQRLKEVSYNEADEGVPYVYVGGSYRVTARAT